MSSQARPIGLPRKESEFKRMFREQTIGYIMAAFGLVAGLAWNDAVKSLIEFLFPLEKSNVTAKFTYAIIMTVILVLITVYLRRIFQEKAENS